MIISNEKLIKVSDTVYKDSDAPKASSLEWRRSFSIIVLPLKNIKIISDFTIHELEWDSENDNKNNPLKLIKPQINHIKAIKSEVNLEEMRA